MCEVVSHEFVMGGHFAQEAELQLVRVAVFSHPPTLFFLDSVRVNVGREPAVSAASSAKTSCLVSSRHPVIWGGGRVMVAWGWLMNTGLRDSCLVTTGGLR